MSNSDKPLSDLIPSLPQSATLEEIADEMVERGIGLKKPTLPINLPSYTFLLGDPQPCFELAEALAAQSQLVYVEDFYTPVYDAVQAYFELDMTINVPKYLLTGANEVWLADHLKTLSSPSYLERRLYYKTEEILSFQDYQIVIRDAKNFNLTRFPAESCYIDLPEKRINARKWTLPVAIEGDILDCLRNIFK